VRRLATAGLLLFAVAAFWLGGQVAAASRAERATWPATEETAILPPPGAAPILAAGYRELAADLIWSRTLVYYGSSLVGETDLRDLERYLDLILSLDPKFKRVYQWAAAAVTYKTTGGPRIEASRVTQEELRASVRYLERGMAAFPDGYEMFYQAGVRYFFDLRSDDPAEQQRLKERGAALVEEAMRKPDAPPDLAASAAALRTRLGQKERALGNLKAMILSVDDEAARAKLLRRAGDVGDEGVVEELQAALATFDDARLDHGRNLPPDDFVLLGPPPPARIDFRELAAERDLFGADDDPTALWDR
jgi:hypothetical protein